MAPSTISNKSNMTLIMKGGGIKGLAYIGAIQVLEEKYEFSRYVGTSAGAVTAVLLAAGYTSLELQKILRDKDFRDFFDGSLIKAPYNLLVHKGIHPADTFTNWLDMLLSAKLGSPERIKLSDLPNRATIYASRQDKRALKFDPFDNDVAAAYAVRCSMSIPFIFMPQSNQGIRTYDGGLQHNYPVDQLLREEPGCQFISLYLGSETYEPINRGSIISDLLATWLDAGEREAITENINETIIIDPRPISTLDFNLSKIEKEFLLCAGKASALKYVGQLKSAKAAIENREQLKSQILIQRADAKSHKKNKRLFAFCTALLLGAGLYVLKGPKAPNPYENKLISSSGVNNDELSSTIIDTSNRGISLLNKKLEIDFRSRVLVPHNKRDTAKISPNIQTYSIRAVKVNDDAQYYTQEFASQRKLMDIECISDHPCAVWHRIDEEPLGKGFKNVWTLVVDVSQHSRDIPFEFDFRVTRYNAYQAKDLNFIGHFVPGPITLIETRVLLPRGYELEKTPIVEVKQKGATKIAWEPYKGSYEITPLSNGAEFTWSLPKPIPNSSYKVSIDWIKKTSQKIF